MHPKIYIVDDDSSVRSSLRLLLKSAGYEVICFESGNEFLKYELDSTKSECIILDVKMPGTNGMELQKEMLLRNSDIPIIFITGHGDIPMSVEAMKNGAVNFLAKPFKGEELLNSIEEALLRNIESRKAQNEQKRLKQKVDTLSPREYEVLRYIIKGMLNKQIGYALNISERTVKGHRKQILVKFGVQSIAELVRLTEKLGIKPIE